MSEKKITSSFVRSLILKRKRDSHKGDYGHVLVIAGSLGLAGASVLSSFGALRSGAGLVTVALPESQQPIVAKKLRPEIMTLSLSETKYKTISLKAFDKILGFIDRRKITSVVLGPGLGVNDETAALVKKLLSNIKLPVILDADGINCIKNGKQALKIPVLKNAKANIIITPHPGEMSRLTGIPVKKINNNRAYITKAFAKENKVICILKGNRTVVSDGNSSYINATGNPGMATAGSGDVLSGMIAGFIKQVKEPRLLNAGLAGVFIHGLAGDIVAKEETEIALIAGDIVEKIPDAIKRIING
ncbi:MAG: NAD(P)H-hydrate dehydratase [Elusimicrobia bacterium]|nr:NAD(P)H-hydrate dehydratase [Candidatus Liberimonas magnetica]